MMNFSKLNNFLLITDLDLPNLLRSFFSMNKNLKKKTHSYTGKSVIIVI